MEWALTLNRHRLYDTWAEESGKLVYTHRNIHHGHTISKIAFDVLNHSSPVNGMITLAMFGAAIGIAAVVSACEFINFLDLCNISLAFSLWCAVKVYSVATSLLFPEVNDLNSQDKQILFLTADYLEVDQLLSLLQLYSHDVRVEYLQETGHPERLQRLLNWYHGNCHMMPEKWEDAIYSAGVSIKKLTLDDAAHVQANFPKFVKWFPNLTELTIHDRSFDISSVEALPNLRHLKKLEVAHIQGQALNYTKVHESVAALHWLTALKMPLGPIPEDTLKKFAELMPDLRTLTILDCRSDITQGHVSALKSMNSLEKLTIEGDFTWHDGKALSDLRELTVTHLALLPQKASNNITSQDVSSLCNMPKLECVQLNHLPINDKTLEEMVEHCLHLRTIALKRCDSFSSSALQAFKKLTSLEELVLECQGIDDEAIPYIADINSLKKLSLYTPGKPIGDQALAALGNSSQLQSLCLFGTHIATNGLKSITTGCQALEILVLDDSKLLENNDMTHLQALKKLRELSINKCSKIGNDAVEEISKVATLTSFSATHTKMTSASWKHWSQHPALDSLTMWSPGHEFTPTPEEIQQLPQQLRTLDVRFVWSLNLRALIEQCPHLVELHPGTITVSSNILVEDCSRLSKLQRFHLEKMRFFIPEIARKLAILPGMQQVYVSGHVLPYYQNLPPGITGN